MNFMVILLPILQGPTSLLLMGTTTPALQKSLTFSQSKGGGRKPIVLGSVHERG